MSKKTTLKRIREDFDAKTSEIAKEYDKKIKELETKMFYQKKKRDGRLIKAEKQLRKDSFLYFTRTLGQEDYNWLIEWLLKKKEEEIKEAEKRRETRHVNLLKKMSAEDYLFYYFSEPEIKGRLEKEMERRRSKDAKRLSFILAKLKMEYYRLDRTRI
jgi:hypothetical protein